MSLHHTLKGGEILYECVTRFECSIQAYFKIFCFFPISIVFCGICYLTHEYSWVNCEFQRISAQSKFNAYSGVSGIWFSPHVTVIFFKTRVSFFELNLPHMELLILLTLFSWWSKFNILIRYMDFIIPCYNFNWSRAILFVEFSNSYSSPVHIRI